MPEITITCHIDDRLMPLLDAMRGKRDLADFLRGAIDLGVAELLSDAARRIADRQVGNLQEVQYIHKEPIVWREVESFLSTAPARPNDHEDDRQGNLI